LKLLGSVAMTLKMLVNWGGDEEGEALEKCARLGRSKEGEAELEEPEGIRNFLLQGEC
jgi:hypothetical protein